ncbi:MAG: hypothetical protein AAGL89_11480 [Pseudomonadota bacterium]
MSRFALTAAALLALSTTSVAAGGYALSFPNLDFPPAETVTVEKNCIGTMTATNCVTDE